MFFLVLACNINLLYAFRLMSYQPSINLVFLLLTGMVEMIMPYHCKCFGPLDGGLFSIKIFFQYSQFFHLYASPSAILPMLQDQICDSWGKVQKCKSCSSSSKETNLIHPASSVQKGNFRNRGYKSHPQQRTQQLPQCRYRRAPRNKDPTSSRAQWPHLKMSQAHP